jgi:hypothetical protein
MVQIATESNSRMDAEMEAEMGQKRQEQLEQVSTLVVFLKPFLNGRNQPGDFVRIPNERVEQYEKSGIARKASPEEAALLSAGGAASGAVALAVGQATPVVRPDAPVPINLAAPVAANRRDAAVVLAQLEAGDMVERIEAQDRFGTIAPHVAAAAKAAAQGAGMAARTQAQVRPGTAVDALLDEQAEEPGARHPYREAAAPGIALSGNIADQTGETEEQHTKATTAQKGQGEPPKLQPALDPVAEARRTAQEARTAAEGSKSQSPPPAEDDVARRARERRERRARGEPATGGEGEGA